MTDHPLESEDDKLPEAEADERFNRLVGNLVNTPHTPHKAKVADNDPTGSEPDQSRD
jgi:hypothetical protein